jgi:subtilisin family serine protease
MKTRTYFLLMILLVVLWSPVAAQESQPVISPALQSRLDGQSQNEKVSVIVILSEQVNVQGIGGRNRAEKRRNLILALQNTSDRTQANLRGILNSLKNNGDVDRFTPLWIINAIAVTGNQHAINALANQPEVQSIALDQIIQGPERTGASSAPEQNINIVNAPALWSMGYQGQGVVVANMDTGVSYTHPDLNAQWRGGSNSWYDPYGQHPATPTDVNGHGTWTMGVMVGRDAGGTSIGVAPQSTWIAVKIFNDSNVATTSAIHLGFQWLLNPDGNLQTNDAPDVVNNSWTMGAPGCDLTFEPDLQALVAAGITPVFAAGNYGPASSTSPSPANNPSAFAVGATDDNDVIYPLSSRGPNTCGGSSAAYPAVVAPGVDIRSSDLYGLYYSATGTSLAAPHVSGAIALLLNAFPNLSVADVRNALTLSAVDLGSAGPDDTFGNGRIDIVAAYNLIAGGGLPTSTPTAIFTVTPTLTPTPSPTATIPPATTLHISDLDRSSVKSGTKWNGTVTIFVHDNYHQPVAGATVYGKWSNGATGNVSCVTNSSGYCSITKTGLKSSVASITFTVTNVTRSGLTYQSSANHDPDGDSNGTVIIVLKP